MKKTLLETLKVFVLASILSIGTTYMYAAWSNPTLSPPNGNAPEPINVSATNQTKAGNLTVSNLSTNNYHRSLGNNGWVSDRWGGGFYMNDSSWLRFFPNNLGIVTGGVMQANSGFRVDGVTRTLSNWVQTQTVTATAGACDGQAIASCPAGWKIVGGGAQEGSNCSCGDYGDHSKQKYSRPQGNSWVASYSCSRGTAYAICAR